MAEIEPKLTGFLAAGEHRVFYELHGEGGRETVCLLNGLAMHTKAWYGFVPELTDRWDVVLYDYLGQGESSSPDEPVTVPQLAGHLASILDELGIERLHPVGISYGGFVALDFARLFPDRLGKLILSGILLSRERQFQMYQDLSLRFYHSGPEAFEIYTHYLYEKIFGEPFLRTVPPETLEEMRQRFHERYAHRVHSLVRLTEAQDPFFDGLEDRLDEYRAVTAPTLVVAGDQDRAIPVWQQEKLLDVFPNSRMEVIPGAGHVVYLEQKERFFGLVRNFLGGN